MNYYRRYVGDYLRDTARLSMLEHGAYNLLLDYYYAEERPISLDQSEVYRMVRALMPEERRAIDKVLTTFFVKAEDGWRHKRVDHEIEVSQTARANGKGGGRPKTGSQTGSETGTETGIQTGDGGGSGHPPTTNLQPPAASLQKDKSIVDLKVDGERVNGKNGHDREEAKQRRSDAHLILQFLNEKARKNYQPVPSNIDLIVALLKQGATPDDMRAVIAKKCREWTTDDEMEKYLRPATLFGPKNFWQKYQGELGAG